MVMSPKVSYRARLEFISTTFFNLEYLCAFKVP